MNLVTAAPSSTMTNPFFDHHHHHHHHRSHDNHHHHQKEDMFSSSVSPSVSPSSSPSSSPPPPLAPLKTHQENANTNNKTLPELAVSLSNPTTTVTTASLLSTGTNLITTMDFSTTATTTTTTPAAAVTPAAAKTKTTTTTTTPDVNDVNPKDVDALLARELNQMSLNEREQVYEEIHGIDRRVVEETPQQRQMALQAMDVAMQQVLQQHPTCALAQAHVMNPSYLNDDFLKLQFLRSEYFQPQAAVAKLQLFMEEKLQLFGPELLARPVYLSDLDKETLKVLKFGQYQVLPARDSTGRAILCDMHMIGKKCVYKNYQSVLRAVVYTVLTAVEDEETQKRGMVAVMYYVGQFTGTFDHDLNKAMSKLPKWLPYRLTGFHICFDDPRLRAWKPLAMLLMGKSLRVRLRIHDGTHTEVQYSLMTFGVPVDALPITYQGELKTAAHLKWIQRRQVKEKVVKTGNAFYGIDLPARNDVILRRGRIFHDHPGNVRMRALIDYYQPEYKSAPMGEKTNIATKIVKTIQTDYGGRFLERRDNDGWWVLVSDKEAGKRVCKSIRSARTTMVAAENLKHQQQQQQQPSKSKSFFAATGDRKKRTKLHHTTTTTTPTTTTYAVSSISATYGNGCGGGGNGSSSGEEDDGFSCFFPKW